MTASALAILPVPRLQSRPGLLRKLPTAKSVRPRVVGNNDAEGTAMNSLSDRNTFGSVRHRERLGSALRRRIAMGMPPKVIAGALGVTVDTVRNWANEENDPSSYMMGELMAFFADRGDFGFWAEVYGPIGETMRKRFAERQAEQAKQAEQERRHIALLTGIEE